MVKLKFFKKDGCDICQMILTKSVLFRDLKKMGLEPEVWSISEVEGLAEAAYYDSVDIPALAVVQEIGPCKYGGTLSILIKNWPRRMPQLDEVLAVMRTAGWEEKV
jgi:hypothetical protein